MSGDEFILIDGSMEGPLNECCSEDLQGNIHTRQRDYLIWKAEQTHNFALRIANYVMSCWSVQSFFRLQVKKPDWVVDHDP